jgi:hypothetical protein
LIVETKQEFIEFSKVLDIINFAQKIPEKEYSHMNLSQIFSRGDFRIDLFEKEVCKKFSLSENMIKRAENS